MIPYTEIKFIIHDEGKQDMSTATYFLVLKIIKWPSYVRMITCKNESTRFIETHASTTPFNNHGKAFNGIRSIFNSDREVNTYKN